MLCVQSWGILQAQQQGEGIILISFPSWLDSWKHIQLFGGILVHLSTPLFFFWLISVASRSHGMRALAT